MQKKADLAWEIVPKRGGLSNQLRFGVRRARPPCTLDDVITELIAMHLRVGLRVERLQA